jgi:isochorismate hydrolase
MFSGNYANIVIHDFRNYQLMAFGSTEGLIAQAGHNIAMFREPTSKREMDRNMAWRINTNNGKIHTFRLTEHAANYSIV